MFELGMDNVKEFYVHDIDEGSSSSSDDEEYDVSIENLEIVSEGEEEEEFLETFGANPATKVIKTKIVRSKQTSAPEEECNDFDTHKEGNSLIDAMSKAVAFVENNIEPETFAVPIQKDVAAASTNHTTSSGSDGK